MVSSSLSRMFISNYIYLNIKEVVRSPLGEFIIKLKLVEVIYIKGYALTPSAACIMIS